MQLFDGDQMIASGGYSQAITTPTLSLGTHTFTARFVDTSGNVSAVSQPFVLTVTAPASAPIGNAPSITGPNGGALPSFSLNEGDLAATQAGSVTLNAADGLKSLTIGDHAVIDAQGFHPGAWTSPDGTFTVNFLAFDAASGQLDFTTKLNSGIYHDSGDTVTEALGLTLTDKDGDSTQAVLSVAIQDQAPTAAADHASVAPGATVAGNVITGAGGMAADQPGVDGAVISTVSYAAGMGTASDFINGGTAEIGGHYGELTINGDGSFSYVADPDAPSGASETFSYWIQQPDNDQVSSTLTITIGAGSSPPPPPPSPPPPSSGQTLTSSGSSNLVGGSGDDTLIGSTGPDTMTGNGGADHFVWQSLPWQAASVTDFTHGVDKLDLSALLSASHYTGSDPIGDGYVKLIDDGQGDAWLYFDTDGHGTADQWGTFVATLQHVATGSVTDADLIFSGAASPPPVSPPPVSPSPVSPPPASGGQTLTSSGSSNLVGGSGDDTLIGSSGPDTMTGNGGADHFVWNSLPWQGGEVTDFTHGVDKLDLSGLLSASHYSGSDPIGDGYVKLIDDGQGDTWLYFDTDGKGAADQWGAFVAKLDHVAPSQVTDSDLIFSGAASPPPASPPPPATMLASTIVTATDDFGPSQGPIPNGGQTDDTTPTFKISISSDVQAGDTVTLHVVENLRPSGLLYNQAVTADDVARGYVLFTPPALPDGQQYLFNTSVTDPAGHQGPLSPNYSFSIQPDSSGQTLQSSGSSNLVGGSGDDTLIGSTGPDTMTGNAGNDHFVWNSLPWQGGEVTDFTHGQDLIDVSHLLASAGYSGSDPIGDGYVKLIDDGQGDTWLYFDTDGHGAADQWGTFVAKLDHVSATSFTSSDFIFH